MERRSFIGLTTTAGIALSANSSAFSIFAQKTSALRLGGPLFGKIDSPDKWVTALQSAGYRAAYCPVKPGADPALIKEYELAALKSDIVIAEVGAWSNPISPDTQVAGAAIQKCKESLALADQIGAACCVNISGSRNEKHWAGPHPDNLTRETFDQIVETTRKIIDEVKPVRTFFTLEAMPWSFPYSTKSYLKLIRAIDRNRFAVHLDPVNFVSSPQVLFSNGAMIRDAFKKLGPYIKSCHAKDVTILENTYLPQLDEVRPGLGYLDYATFVQELMALGDIPLMMEHLKSEEEYAAAAQYIRSFAI